MPNALVIGCGYSGRRIARELVAAGWQVTGTTTHAAHLDEIAALGARPLLLDLMAEEAADPELARLTAVVGGHEAVVHCVGPLRMDRSEAFRDVTAPLVRACRKAVPRAFVYLSSTGVYGDCGGAWVDEQTPPGRNLGPRGTLRVQVEEALLAAWRAWGLPVTVLRLSGIYGPGRHLAPRLMAGTYRVVTADPPLIVNRIHVDDIAHVVHAVLARERGGETYVVSDNLPASLREVADYTASLLGLSPPSGESVEAARGRLGEANMHLIADQKRCANRKLTERLGITLRYPTYREGILQALREDGLL